MAVYAGAMPQGQTVAITGGTGLVGSRLAAKLAAAGNKVVVLTRDASAAQSKVGTGIEVAGPSEWAAAIAKSTAVVNLAGEPIATRWSPEVKSKILSSRVGTTKAVVAAIRSLPPGSRPKVLVSASAVGYYGTSPTNTFTEASRSGDDYLAQVCREWEDAAIGVPEDVRCCIVRIGIVLAKEGGALGKMMPIFQLFAGGPLGSGGQWMSWIHRDDLVDLICEAIVNGDFKGAFNATAPQPVRMSEFCQQLGSVMGRPSLFPAPEFVLKAVLGEGAVLVLEGQRVVPSAATDLKFRFKYSDVYDALSEIVRS